MMARNASSKPVVWGLSFDLRRGAFRRDAAAVDYGDAMRQRVSILQIMRGQQDAAAARHEAANAGPQSAARFHVEPDSRFVEKQNIGVAADGQRKEHALFLAARRSPNRRFSIPASPAAAMVSAIEGGFS